MSEDTMICLERIADALEGMYRIMLNKESYEFDLISSQDYEDFLNDEREGSDIYG